MSGAPRAAAPVEAPLAARRVDVGQGTPLAREAV